MVTRLSGPFRRPLSAGARFSAQHADRPTDPVVMARAMGFLFFAGAAIGFVSLLLPQSPDARLPAVAAVCAVAMGLSVVFWFRSGRLPQWVFTAALFGGTLLINAAIYWSDRPASSYAFSFVCVVMCAAYFMSTAQTVVQAASVA